MFRRTKKSKRSGDLNSACTKWRSPKGIWQNNFKLLAKISKPPKLHVFYQVTNAYRQPNSTVFGVFDSHLCQCIATAASGLSTSTLNNLYQNHLQYPNHLIRGLNDVQTWYPKTAKGPGSYFPTANGCQFGFESMIWKWSDKITFQNQGQTVIHLELVTLCPRNDYDASVCIQDITSAQSMHPLPMAIKEQNTDSWCMQGAGYTTTAGLIGFPTLPTQPIFNAPGYRCHYYTRNCCVFTLKPQEKCSYYVISRNKRIKWNHWMPGINFPNNQTYGFPGLKRGFSKIAFYRAWSPAYYNAAMNTDASIPNQMCTGAFRIASFIETEISWTTNTTTNRHMLVAQDGISTVSSVNTNIKMPQAQAGGGGGGTDSVVGFAMRNVNAQVHSAVGPYAGTQIAGVSSDQLT